MSLSGKKIVFSGTMSLKRAEAKSQAESAGAKVLTSVSNTVDILVIGGDIAGKKVADAQAKGVEIWTEADFVKAITAHMFPTASPPAKKKKTTALSTGSSSSSSSSSSAAMVNANTGVDAGLAKINATLAANAVLLTHTDGESMDARLAQVDLSKNTDKYYVLQAVTDHTNHYVYSHWGKTGTVGQQKLEGPISKAKAIKEFEKIYKDKTGRNWEDKIVGGTPLAKKYQHLSVSSRSSQSDGKWEYYLTNDPFGKKDGWYDYDKTAGNEVEKLYLDHQDNPTMTVRFVHAESSGYNYKVDLEAGTQTNTTSGKCRPIRRKTD